MKKTLIAIMGFALSVTLFSCGGGTKPAQKEVSKPVAAFTGAKGEVKIITLDPGHFHAALVQKDMYDQVSPEVFVYAPDGNELNEHLKRIDGYNTRAQSPTTWTEKIYKGNDYLDKMLAEKPGNVVVVSGNNRIKTDYIKKSVEAGLNVLADKPMVISEEAFPALEESFKIAKEKGVLLYDIMTERFSVTTVIQRELSMLPDLFGQFEMGTNDKPAIEMVSVHNFLKEVSGKALVRPAWFFDVNQQGEGIVDVNTHLVDLVQWICFPEQIVQKSDINILSGKRWPTILTKDEFKVVTGTQDYPVYLQKDVKEDKLNVFANGEILYNIKGHVAKVTAVWDYKAPAGGGDTHYAMMHGSKCSLEIKQGVPEKYDPTLYIKANEGVDIKAFGALLEKMVTQNLEQKGCAIEKLNNNTWKVIVREPLKIGHEAHFAQVTKKFLQYLKAGKLPEWEVPNMITKYYTTTAGLKMAKAAK